MDSKYGVASSDSGSELEDIIHNSSDSDSEFIPNTGIKRRSMSVGHKRTTKEGRRDEPFLKISVPKDIPKVKKSKKRDRSTSKAKNRKGRLPEREGPVTKEVEPGIVEKTGSKDPKDTKNGSEIEIIEHGKGKKGRLPEEGPVAKEIEPETVEKTGSNDSKDTVNESESAISQHGTDSAPTQETNGGPVEPKQVKASAPLSPAKALEELLRSLTIPKSDKDKIWDCVRNNFEPKAAKIVQPRTSYAKVAAGKKATKAKPALLVYSLKENAVDLKKSLEKAVDRRALNLSIENVRPIRNNGLAIEVNSLKDRDVLREKIKESDPTLLIKDPTKRKPLVVIYDGSEEEDFLPGIAADNDLKGPIIRKFTMKNRNGGKHIVAQVEPSDFGKLMQKGKVFSGWTRHNVREFLQPLRCFNCYRYGHSKKHCTNKQACERCGEEHLRKVCKSSTEKCVNCVEFNAKFKGRRKTDHRPTDTNCPTYQKELERLKLRTDYG